MTGDCEVRGDCVTSPNYPEPYGAYEECFITMLRSAMMSPSLGPWAIAASDILIVDGVHVDTPNALPGQIGRGGIITWGTDWQRHGTGWQICFSEPGTTAEPSLQGTTVEPTSQYNTVGPTKFTAEPTLQGTTVEPTLQGSTVGPTSRASNSPHRFSGGKPYL